MPLPLELHNEFHLPPSDLQILRVVTPAVLPAVGRATKVPRYGFFPGPAMGNSRLSPWARCLRRRMVLDGLDESGEYPKNERRGVCQAPLRRPREHLAFGMYSKGPIEGPEGGR